MSEAAPIRSAVIRFGGFDLDLPAGDLHKAGLCTRLQYQPLEILILLLERPGQLVTRDEVRTRLWPKGTTVDAERSINTAVRRLREALGDDADRPRFVETVPRRGYRFIAPVEVVPRSGIGSPVPRSGTPRPQLRGSSHSGGPALPDEASADTALPETGDRYTLLERIGAGAMGEVFRARDLRLQRDVAVKFLPAWMAEDPMALHRFRREAHATAALNHPNVLAVYDLALVDGAPCLVSELLEGRTLRQLLSGGWLTLSDAIGHAQEILSGLAAAHEKGIVHRDLKPENIFVTNDGRVKILDFGLAKRVAAPMRDGSMETTVVTPTTRTGAVLGTLGYQSPEQARGEEVDHRSDLFAFGAVLYELLTGRRPFYRPTEADTIAAVLNAEPAAPSAVNPAVPASCDALVAKALEKDRELRYQSAAEVKSDLLRVRRELSGGTSLPGTAHTGSGALPRPRRRRRVLVAVLGTLVLIGLASAAVVLLRDWTSVPEFQPTQLTQGESLQLDPALSPDGQFIAYTSDEGGEANIYVMDRRNRIAILRTDGQAIYRRPAWMPDGSELLFVSIREGRPSVWRMPTIAGRPRLVVEDADDVAVSPDGRQIAFVRVSPSSGNRRIWTAPLADVNAARMLTGDKDGLWDHREPAWSPDGREICYRAQTELWVVQTASGGPARRVVSEGQSELSPAWSHDGHAIYFSSGREGTRAIWRLRLGTSLADKLQFWRHPRVERVTLGTGGEQQPAISRDGRLLAHSTQRDQSRLVLYDLAGAREVPWDGPRQGSMPSISADGRRVYFVAPTESRFDQLWALDLEDGQPSDKAQALTNHAGHVSHPACSPDGQWVAYYVVEKKPGATVQTRSLWMVPASSGPATRITEGPVDTLPAWSSDSRRLVYKADEGGLSHLWTVAVANGRAAGRPVQITSGALSDDGPAFSPDGSLVAFRRESAQRRNRFDVWVSRADGQGVATRVTDGANAYRLQWDETAPGALLVAATWGGSNLEVRRVGLPGRRVKPLVPAVVMGPEKDELVDFSVSRDGRLLVFSRTRRQSNIWLLEALKGTF